MSWEKYKESSAVKHDFEGLGCPEFYVKLRRVDSFPYGEIKDYMNAAEEAGISGTEDMTEADLDTLDIPTESGLSVNDETLVKCIHEWHITHPETGEELSEPTFDDISSLDALPTEFIVQMHRWLAEDSNLQGDAASFRG